MSEKQELTLELPNSLSFSIHPKILEYCHMLWRMSDYQVVPDPRVVALMDSTYLDELFRWHQGIQFFIDYPRRPLNMR